MTHIFIYLVSPLACDMGLNMSRHFLVLWQGSLDTDWALWFGCHPILILSKRYHTGNPPTPSLGILPRTRYFF